MIAPHCGFTEDQFSALASKGFDLIEGGDFEAAAVVFAGLVAVDPSHAPSLATFGAALQELGRLAEAEVAYNDAIELDPSIALARVNRGQLRWQRGEAAAIDDLLTAAASGPSRIRARATRLLAAIDLKRPGQA